jgi:hypothetical protein
VDRGFPEATPQGETIFVRLSSKDGVTYPQAAELAAATQRKLQNSPSYDFGRWVFLIDFSFDGRSGDDYSIGQLVNNGSGYRMSQKGDWLDTAPSLNYQVVKRETYTAWIAGRFPDGVKVHVIPANWEQVELIARSIAESESERGVAVFFWRNSGDVGMQSAEYGAELIDGKVTKVLVDHR